MDVGRENRILRTALIVLFCALAADLAVVRSQQPPQKVPGPGSGIVDVAVGNRVHSAQAGEWNVGVHGTVATLPSMPPHIKARGRYTVRWPGDQFEELTVEELHPSGWARVAATRWVNLATAAQIISR